MAIDRSKQQWPEGYATILLDSPRAVRLTPQAQQEQHAAAQQLDRNCAKAGTVVGEITAVGCALAAAIAFASGEHLQAGVLIVALVIILVVMK